MQILGKQNESNLPPLLYTIRKVQRGVNCFGVKSKIGQVVQQVCIDYETVKNEWDQFQEVMGWFYGPCALVCSFFL